MTRLMLPVVAVVAAGVMAAQDGQPVFRAGTDAVRVDVSVRDGGRPVTNLSAADFEVFDNGVAQQVSAVTYGRLPIDVTVVLDVSQSVDGVMLTYLQRATVQLMRELAENDRLKLVGVNTRVSRVMDFTADAAAVERAVNAAVAGGGSSIRDAAAVALVSAADPARRHLVVLFTDGADSSSTSSEDTLLEVARRTNAALTVVVPDRLTTYARTPAITRYLGYLDRLTAETGGSVLTTARNSTPPFGRALGEFRSSYVLYFTPTGVARAGFHALDVRVRRDGDLAVRARRGYFER
jgi:VWFA-related protein